MLIKVDSYWIRTALRLVGLGLRAGTKRPCKGCVLRGGGLPAAEKGKALPGALPGSRPASGMLDSGPGEGAAPPSERDPWTLPVASELTVILPGFVK